MNPASHAVAIHLTSSRWFCVTCHSRGLRITPSARSNDVVCQWRCGLVQTR